LKRALDSIAVQGVENLEVLLGDDASSDDTIAVARAALPGIRVATLGRNSGAAAARNAAALLARGHFLAFLDSDDEWLPGKLQAQLDFLARHSDVGICACGHELVRQNGDVKTCYGRNPDDWPLSLSFAQSFHGASTPLIRHDVWRKVGPQDESLRVLEDWDWMLRASRTTNIHVLASPGVRIYENRPSDPDFTLLSTERFLAKHETTFADFPRRVHREIVSQHWENAGKTGFSMAGIRADANCCSDPSALHPGEIPGFLRRFHSHFETTYAVPTPWHRSSPTGSPAK
jgi:GT2 family glycosyltransferase